MILAGSATSPSAALLHPVDQPQGRSAPEAAGLAVGVLTHPWEAMDSPAHAGRVRARPVPLAHGLARRDLRVTAAVGGSVGAGAEVASLNAVGAPWASRRVPTVVRAVAVRPAGRGAPGAQASASKAAGPQATARP